MPEVSSRELRRAADRFVTHGDGITTVHSFSYGAHYDPANVGFGALSAINVEHLAPGRGYDAHRHADVDIVTWVVEGVLAHRDTTGVGGIIGPGTVQRLSAGTGAEHTERNASATEPLCFVQTMLRSTHEGAPEYALVEVPGGPGRYPGVSVHAAARLEIIRPAEPVAVEIGRRLLVHVTRGTIAADGDPLNVGDELRVVATGGSVLLVGGGEALVWHLE
ncbi:MAG: pirin family protein [Aeromicrobium sp.]|uniref:pirin family protein n=1 Tax=Aeromicrobium sp. TaxID=1871063 RepID=UPI0039E2D7BB